MAQKTNLVRIRLIMRCKLMKRVSSILWIFKLVSKILIALWINTQMLVLKVMSKINCLLLLCKVLQITTRICCNKITNKLQSYTVITRIMIYLVIMVNNRTTIYSSKIIQITNNNYNNKTSLQEPSLSIKVITKIIETMKWVKSIKMIKAYAAIYLINSHIQTLQERNQIMYYLNCNSSLKLMFRQTWIAKIMVSWHHWLMDQGLHSWEVDTPILDHHQF